MKADCTGGDRRCAVRPKCLERPVDVRYLCCHPRGLSTRRETPLVPALPRSSVGRSQAVRQRILIPPFGGSIPPAPASIISDFKYLGRDLGGPSCFSCCMALRMKTADFLAFRGVTNYSAQYARNTTFT